MLQGVNASGANPDGSVRSIQRATSPRIIHSLLALGKKWAPVWRQAALSVMVL